MFNTVSLNTWSQELSVLDTKSLLQFWQDTANERFPKALN